MMSKDYIGYIEGADISKIPANFLAYPSKNVLIYKGVAYTRPGIKNDGTPFTGNFNIIGERVWKDALAGELPLRVTVSGNLQLKYLGKWITIYSGFDAGKTHVRFSTWTDANGLIIKNRMFAVNGTDAIWEWAGGLGVIQSVNAGAHTVTIAGAKTLQQLGFDPGNSTPQAVRIVRFNIDGTVAGIDDYTNTDDASSTTAQLSGAFANTPNAGDIIISGWIKHTDILTGILKDDLYTYKNRLTIGCLTSLRVYFSNVVTKLDYVVPAAVSRTAISPFFVDLPSNYTAMISRLNQSTQETTLWISDVEGWTKVNALITQDSFGNWVATQRVNETERLGALPFAVADFKGDSIFLAQDSSIQRIETIAVLGKDDMLLISDEIVDLLKRMDKTEMRLYYDTRYIYAAFPADSTLVMIDTIETHGPANVSFGCQPPQTLPISHMSIIGGVLCGHSNVRDETFVMFSGRDDLGVGIESVFAFGYYQGYQRVSRATHVTQDFFLKSMTKIGVSCRMTKSTQAAVVTDMENDGFKGTFPFTIDGSKVKSYAVPDDESWASHIWGDASIGGADDPADPLVRVYAWSTTPRIGWFEFRPIFTVTGKSQEFHLLGWYINDTLDPTTTPNDLFIERDTS